MDTNSVYTPPTQPPAPQASPPGYPPAPPDYAPAGAVPAPKKKRKGCVIAAIVAVVLLLCGCLGVALALTIASSDEEAAAYSEADFDSAVAKVGVTWPELPAGEDPADYERVYTGQKPVDVTLTSSEISALMSFRHDPSYWPIKSMEVELTGGNSATASMVVTYAGRDWPVTASGSGTAAGGGLDLSLSSASVMGFDVPADYLPMGGDILEEIINPRLARAGITIETLEPSGDGVRFVGTVWESAEYVPKP